MEMQDIVLFAFTSMAVAASVIVGTQLLLHNDMSYLGIMDTAVGVLITVAVAMIFLGEKLTINKILGLLMILAGAYVVNMPE